MTPPFRLAQAALLAATSWVATGCVDIVANNVEQHVVTEEKRFATSSSPSINLNTFDGAIEVTSWDRAEVLVTIEKRGFDADATDSIKVEMQQAGDEISVAARSQGNTGGDHLFGWQHNRGAKLIVVAPRNAAVRARSGDGRIDVRDLRGDIVVQTGDGAIRVEDVDGSVDAQSGDGSIRVNGTLTRVRARSGDGSVVVRADSGSAAQDDWSITTGDGSVTVELPASFNAELDAHSGDGRVRISEAALSLQRRDDRSTVRGRLGDGGRDLRVRTGDGSITIRQF
jgi:DUF4097 and DUF4098 domain-containing protein YvlB